MRFAKLYKKVIVITGEVSAPNAKILFNKKINAVTIIRDES